MSESCVFLHACVYVRNVGLDAQFPCVGVRGIFLAPLLVPTLNNGLRRRLRVPRVFECNVNHLNVMGRYVRESVCVWACIYACVWVWLCMYGCARVGA